MCFSAPASFTAGVGLSVIGVIAIAKARTPVQRVFAAIPLIFAMQQCSEGLLWLSLLNEDYKSFYKPCMYLFLFFAQVLWPSFVPISVLLLEKHPPRRRVLYFLSSVGLATSCCLLFCLFRYGASATAGLHHIAYQLAFPGLLKWFAGLCYLISAVLSPFISSHKSVRWFGLVLLASYLITRMFYFDYLVSVWCYFAGILSLIVLMIIIKLRKESLLK